MQRLVVLLGALVAIGCSRTDSNGAPAPSASSAATHDEGAHDASPSASASSSAASAGDAGPQKDAPRAGAPVTPKLDLDTSDQSPGQWKTKPTGLPALSDDGARIAYVDTWQNGVHDSPTFGRTWAVPQSTNGDGPYANDTLVVRRVDGDALEKEIRVFDPKEVSKAESAPNASGTTLPALVKKLGARVEQANALLAANKWVALAEAPQDRARPTVHTGGMEISLVDGKLRAVHATGRSLAEVDVKPWTAKGFSIGNGMAPCSFRPELAGAAVDETRHVLVAHIVQDTVTGGDPCNAKDVLHAIRLQ